MTGLGLRTVERGLALLAASGKISLRYGRRRRAHRGRIITLHMLGDGPNPRVDFPSRERLSQIWRLCSGVRERPSSIVALAVAVHVWAAAETGRDTGTISSHAPMQALRHLVGAAHGSTFSRRLADLERAGVLRRVGRRWRDGLVLPVLAVVVERPQPVRLPAAPMQVVRRTNLASLAAAMAAW